jgi:hypothetical protein
VRAIVFLVGNSSLTAQLEWCLPQEDQCMSADDPDYFDMPELVSSSDSDDDAVVYVPHILRNSSIDGNILRNSIIDGMDNVSGENRNRMIRRIREFVPEVHHARVYEWEDQKLSDTWSLITDGMHQVKTKMPRGPPLRSRL